MESSIKESVQRMYLLYPYPQWSQEERHRRFSSELCRYEFLGLAQFMENARFLDVGCGTGNRSMLAAKHYGVREFVGLDDSSASLEIAGKVAEEEEFERFTPVEGDLFNIPYPDGSFDVVVSWGVLHHTDNPYGGLAEMVRVCRPGGFVGVFLYNAWNHWRHNMQKAKVARLAGDDIEERFDVAHKLYGTKPIEQMGPGEVAEFFDQYCHPHKSDHTLGETLGWLRQLGLSYWGSYPPLRIRDFARLIHRRAELADEYALASGLTRSVTKLSSVVPNFARREPPFRHPTVLHRFLWQAVYAWMGRHGEYSSGAALCAKKR